MRWEFCLFSMKIIKFHRLQRYMIRIKKIILVFIIFIIVIKNKIFISICSDNIKINFNLWHVILSIKLKKTIVSNHHFILKFHEKKNWIDKFLKECSN